MNQELVAEILKELDEAIRGMAERKEQVAEDAASAAYNAAILARGLAIRLERLGDAVADRKEEE